MRIRKNGKVVRLTESDLMRITRKVLREQKEPKFSLMDIGMGGDDLEDILSRIVQDYDPREDKTGTYVSLNPADFTNERFDTVFGGSPTPEKRMAGKIRKKLVDSKLLAKNPGSSEKNRNQGGYMFGPKGNGSFKIYFKSPKNIKF
jgi:hypothetical protein